MTQHLRLRAALVLAAVAVSGCGTTGSSQLASPAPVSAGTAAGGPTSGGTGAGGPSTAGTAVAGTETNPAGDIPDSQAYVDFRPAAGGFTLKIPEGWAQTTVSNQTRP